MNKILWSLPCEIKRAVVPLLARFVFDIISEIMCDFNGVERIVIDCLLFR